jgi:membrane protein DedA with SNARE-associated domain
MREQPLCGYPLSIECASTGASPPHIDLGFRDSTTSDRKLSTFGPLPSNTLPLPVDLNSLVQSALMLLQQNAAVAPGILFTAMLLEGIVLTTFIFSATLLALAAGMLIQAGLLSFFPTSLAIFAGLWMGDAINYALARRGKDCFHLLRAVQQRKHLVQRAESLVSRWGFIAVFSSRFMGPSRPFVTFMAGVMKMSAVRFHIASATSTLLLTFVLLAGGMKAAQMLPQ